MSIFVNRPQGGVVPDDYDFGSFMGQMYMGSAYEPKIGCVDNGQKTREDRVIIVYDDELMPVRHATVYNRKGSEYKVSTIPTETLSQLEPLLRIGVRVFDCGFFPTGERAGDLVIYGIPMAKGSEAMRTYAQMRRTIERYYPVYLDKRVLERFKILGARKKLSHFTKNGRPSGLVSFSVDIRKDPEPITKQRITPYWYEPTGGPQVYILPSYESGEYLKKLWQAMKECPETTYEGFVVKNYLLPDMYTETQAENQSHVRIRFR